MKKRIISMAALVIMLCACGHQQSMPKQPVHVYTVTAKKLHKVLHFTGTVQPLHESSIVSPMNAVVETMSVHYGQRVKKNAILFTLTSSELQKQYNDTLTDYLKAKDSYAIIQAKFHGTEDLWHAGLLAKNNYLSEKSGVDTARVTLMQASRKLTELLEKMDEHKTIQVSTLNLSDFTKIKAILMSKHNMIHLKAPGDGVMLYPPKSGEDKSSRIGVGAAVKSGQVVALVGDLSGISVEIDVPEVDIDKVHSGMSALIHGVAFGAHELRGRVVVVNAQASSNSTGGLPSFTAVVEVKKLSAKAQQWIKVGMSAAIELQVDTEQLLFVPIAAVFREQGASFVLVKRPDGTTEKRRVTTGAVQAGEVVIDSGLKEGDVVIYE